MPINVDPASYMCCLLHGQKNGIMKLIGKRDREGQKVKRLTLLPPT